MAEPCGVEGKGKMPSPPSPYHLWWAKMLTFLLTRCRTQESGISVCFRPTCSSELWDSQGYTERQANNNKEFRLKYEDLH